MADPTVPEGTDQIDPNTFMTEDEQRAALLQALEEEQAKMQQSTEVEMPERLTPLEQEVTEQGIDPYTATPQEKAARLSAQRKMTKLGQRQRGEGMDVVPSMMAQDPTASLIQYGVDQAVNQIPGGRVLYQGLEESLYQTGRSLVGLAGIGDKGDTRDKIEQDALSEGASAITGYLASFALNNYFFKGLGVGNATARSLLAGGVTDAFQVDPYAAGIGDLLEEYVPGANKSDFINWFTAENKKDDPIWEARFKSALEGILLGLGVDVAFDIGGAAWRSVKLMKEAHIARTKGNEKVAEELTEQAAAEADKVAEVTGMPRFDPEKQAYDAGWFYNKDILPKESSGPYDARYTAMADDATDPRVPSGQVDFRPAQLDSQLAGDLTARSSAPIVDIAPGFNPEEASRFFRENAGVAESLGITADTAEEAVARMLNESFAKPFSETEAIFREGGASPVPGRVTSNLTPNVPIQGAKKKIPTIPVTAPRYEAFQGIAEKARKAREPGAQAPKGGDGTGPSSKIRTRTEAGEVVQGTPVGPVTAARGTVAVRTMSKEATEAFIKNVNMDYDTAIEHFNIAFNAGKIRTSEDAHAMIGQAAKALRDEGIKIDHKVTYEEIRTMAEEMAVNPAEMFKRLSLLAGSVDDLPAVVTAARYTLASLGDQLVKKGQHITQLAARGKDTAAALEDFQRTASVMQAVIPELKLVRHRAAAATASGNIPAFSLKTAEEVMNKIRLVEGDSLTAAMLVGKMSTSDALKVTQRAMKGGNWWDALLQWRTGMLLYGPKTMMTNLVGTATWGVAKAGMRVMGGAMEALVTGSGKPLKDQARLFAGATSATRDSWRNMKRALYDNESVLDPSQGSYEMHGRAFESLASQYVASGKIPDAMTIAGQYADKFSTLPMRALVGQDEFFKQMSYRSFMYQKAMGIADLQVANGTLKEADRAAKVEEIIKNSFDPETGQGIDAEALQYAREATFTQDLGPWGQEFQRVANAIPPLRFVFPFIRTPTNLLSEGLQMFPGAQFASKRFRADLFSGDPNRRAEALGKIATGTAIAATAMYYATQGLITGRSPTDPNARARFDESKRLPYSILDQSTGRWIQYNRMDPFAIVLGMAADISLAATNEGFDEQQSFAAMALGASEMLRSKSYFAGITDTLDLVGWGRGSDEMKEQSSVKAAGRMLSTFIPNFASQLSAEDSVLETRNILDASIAKLAVFGGSGLPPKRDAIGVPIIRNAGWLVGEVPNWLSPLTYGMKPDSPVREALYQAQASISKPDSKEEKVSLLDYKNKDGQDAYDRLQELTSTIKIGDMTIMERLEQRLPQWVERYGDIGPIQNPDNRNQRRSPIQDDVEEIVGAYRKAARQQVYREYPELYRAIQNARQFKKAPSNPLNQLRN